MNGKIVREKIHDGMFTAASQIADLADDDRMAVETAFLAVLTRRPSPEELSHFAWRLTKTSGKVRKERLSDLYWALLNTTESAWNH